MIVWVDTVEDTEEIIRGLDDDVTPYAGFDDDGFYLQVDLTGTTTVAPDPLPTVEEPAGAIWHPGHPEYVSPDPDLPDPQPADEVDGADDSGPPAPASSTDHDGHTVDLGSDYVAGLAAQICQQLRSGPLSAGVIADSLGVGRDEVMATLRELKRAERVESAGVKGWKLRHRRFDHDAARARAAAAL
jgi:biotin operon repressor